MRYLGLFIAPYTNYEHKLFHSDRVRYRHWGGVTFVDIETPGLRIGPFRPDEGLKYTCGVSCKADWYKKNRVVINQVSRR